MDYIKKCELLIEKLSKERNIHKQIEIQSEICRLLRKYGEEQAELFNSDFERLQNQYDSLLEFVENDDNK